MGKYVLEKPKSSPDPTFLEQEQLPFDERVIRDAVWELEIPMQKLLAALRPEIEAGAYTSLFGDDVSARIPTLVLRDIVNRAYAQAGRKAIVAYFFAGGSNLRDEAGNTAIRGHIDSLKPKLGARTLLIEEYIQTGSRTKEIVKLLSDLGVGFDLVSITSYFPKENARRDLDLLPESRFYVGDDNTVKNALPLPKIYGLRNAAGVVKRLGQAVSAPRTTEGGKDGRRLMVFARKEAARLAATLSEWYERAGKSPQR